jgi:hypothetical protein
MQVIHPNVERLSYVSYFNLKAITTCVAFVHVNKRYALHSHSTVRDDSLWMSADAEAR